MNVSEQVPRLVLLILFGVPAVPISLFIAHKLGLLPHRIHEVLQGLYCFALVGLFIAFGIAYVAETGGIFKPQKRKVELQNVYFAEDPFFFLVTCGFLLFLCSFLLIGGWDLLRGKRKSKGQEARE